MNTLKRFWFKTTSYLIWFSKSKPRRHPEFARRNGMKMIRNMSTKSTVHNSCSNNPTNIKPNLPYSCTTIMLWFRIESRFIRCSIEFHSIPCKSFLTPCQSLSRMLCIHFNRPYPVIHYPHWYWPFHSLKSLISIVKNRSPRSGSFNQRSCRSSTTSSSVSNKSIIENHCIVS